MKTIKQKRLEKYLELMNLSEEELRSMYEKSFKADHLSSMAFRHKTDLKFYQFEMILTKTIPAIIFSVAAYKSVKYVCDTVSTIKDEENYIPRTKTSYVPKSRGHIFR